MFAFRLPPPSFVFALALPLCAHATGAFAAVPSLKGVFPAGGMRGMEVDVLLEGKPEKGRIWVEGAGVTFSAPDDKGKSKAVIAPDAAPGLRLLRVVNAEGASEAVRFMVGTLPEVIEVKPNQAPTQAQFLEKLPVWINGRIDRAGEVDHFAFLLKKDQVVRMEVYAYTLGSLIDPLLHVLDPRGTRIATASDGRNLDPGVSFKAPVEGRYTVQLAGFAHPPASEVSFTGGSTVVYRLLLHSGPLVTSIFPAVVCADAVTAVTLRGVGLPKDPVSHQIPALSLAKGARFSAITVPNAVQSLEALVSQTLPQVEIEPNDIPGKAMAMMALPAVVGGTIQKRGDLDCYSFPVKKAQKLRAEVYSQRLGLPLDASLKVFDENGKNLGSAEDQKDLGDPVFNWTVAADGTHQVMVADQFHRGGEGSDYVLEIREVAPAFEVTLADGKPLKGEAGKKIELKVNVKLLDGWKEPLVLRVLGLPDLLSKAELPVPAKGGELTFAIEPLAEFPAGTHPFSMVVCKPDGTQAQEATYDLRGENRRGTSLSDRDETLWLTVTSTFVGPPSPGQ